MTTILANGATIGDAIENVGCLAFVAFIIWLLSRKD